jgi:hypothetical protein
MTSVTYPKCLVCGHYHGGQGGCIIAHAFVKPEDCPTCMKKEGKPMNRDRYDVLLVLGRDPLPFHANEDDFLAWVAYAATRIDRESGLCVYVSVRDPDEELQRNYVACADPADELTLHDALQRLWTTWLELGAPRIVIDDVDPDDVPTVPRMRAATAAGQS